MPSKSLNTFFTTAAVAIASASLFVGYSTYQVLTRGSESAGASSSPVTSVGTVGAYLLTTHALPPKSITGVGFQKELSQHALSGDTGRLLVSQFQKCSDAGDKLTSLSVVNGYVEAANIKGFEDPQPVALDLAKKSKWFTYSQAFEAKGVSKLIDFSSAGWAPSSTTNESAEVLSPEKDIQCQPLAHSVSPYPFKTLKDVETAANFNGTVDDEKGRSWEIRKTQEYLIAKLHQVKDSAELSSIAEEFDKASRIREELPASRSKLSLDVRGAASQAVLSDEFRYSSGAVRIVTSDSRIKNASPILTVMWQLPAPLTP
jgi:hypothetical protein